MQQGKIVSSRITRPSSVLTTKSPKPKKIDAFSALLAENTRSSSPNSRSPTAAAQKSPRSPLKG